MYNEPSRIAVNESDAAGTIFSQRQLKRQFRIRGRFPDFTQVLLETRTDCNRCCSFCPQGHRRRPLVVMSKQVFVRVMMQLKQMNYSGRLGFGTYNEPTLDRRLFQMVKYARNKLPHVYINITTNGDNISLNWIENAFAAGIDEVNINDYRGAQDALPAGVAKHLAQILSAYYWNPKLQHKIRYPDRLVSNCASNAPSRSATKIQSSGFCNYPFRKLVINPHGQVVSCCNDYKYETVIGHVMSGDLLMIWHAEKMNQMRQALLLGRRKGLCSQCDDRHNYANFMARNAHSQ